MKCRWVNPYALCALALIAGAVLLRVVLVGQGWPVSDSDEGTMGLMALHIAERGERPVFFYGQSYMGALEAYLGALLFHLFGVSVFALRLGPIALFALFLGSTYLLTGLLYDRRLALVTLALLSPGSGDLLSRQLVATGGRLETLLFGSLALLLAAWLALSRGQRPCRRGRRPLAYAAWGLAVGLGLWSDLLILPFAGVAGLLLLLCCRRELRPRLLLVPLLGLLLGAAPLIAYNVTAAFGAGSFRALLDVGRTGGTGTFADVTLGQSVAGTLLVSLPLATGAAPLGPSCRQNAGGSTTLPPRCALAYGGWSGGVLVLWVVATVLAMRALRLSRRHPATGKPTAMPGECDDGTRQLARLMLLAGAGLTLALFTLSPAPARDPWGNTRYLVGLLIAVPAVLAPLWEWSGTTRSAARRTVAFPLLGPVALLGVGLTLLAGTIGVFGTLPTAQRADRETDTLIAQLLALGATHIYTDYWTCYRVAFQSRERIICSVFDERIELSSEDRYPPYQRQVREAPSALYVFPLASPQAAALAGRVAAPDRQRATVVALLDGYIAYRLMPINP